LRDSETKLGRVLRELGWKNKPAADRIGLAPNVLMRMARDGENPTMRTAARVVAALTPTRDVVLERAEGRVTYRAGVPLVHFEDLVPEGDGSTAAAWVGALIPGDREGA